MLHICHPYATSLLTVRGIFSHTGSLVSRDGNYSLKRRVPQKHFDAAKRVAAGNGARHLLASKVVVLPVDKLLASIDSNGKQNGPANLIESDAVLEGAGIPSITVSEALDAYWNLEEDKLL